jgi:hypothetical protein
MPRNYRKRITVCCKNTCEVYFPQVLPPSSLPLVSVVKTLHTELSQPFRVEITVTRFLLGESARVKPSEAVEKCAR